MNSIQIGTVKIPKGTRYTQHYDCAAWYDTIEIEEDVEVPLLATMDRNRPNKIEDYGPAFGVTGKVVGANHTSYWCGVSVGNPRIDTPEDLGKSMKFCYREYAHALAKRLLEGERVFGGGTLTLDPGFRAVEIPFTHNGENLVTYGIVRA